MHIAMTKSSFTFLRVRGIPIGAHWTWAVVFLLLMSSLARQVFPATAPNLPGGAYWAMAAVTAVLFFTSIVLHELGHAFRALREGMKIDGITLWLFGGIARFLGSFPSPGAEFRVAIAGPAVSLAIAVFMWVVALGAGALGLPVAIAAVARYLARINFVLVAFNLVPALPLDGGRVLRAVLWHRQKNFTTATISASRAGRAFAFVLIGMGVAGLLTRVAAGGAMFAFLGYFLLQAARSEAQYALMLRSLGGLTVGDVMTRDPLVVPPGTTITRFFDEVTRGRSHTTYPVAEDGRLAGLVSVSRAGAVRADARDRTTVAEIMTPREKTATIRPDAPALDALPALQSGAPAAVVVSDGDPVGGNATEHIDGIVTVTDIARGVELQQARAAQIEEPAKPAGWGVWAVVVFAMALCVGFIYHPPYIVLSPGPAIDLSGDVRISGTEVHPVNGRYLLVSVRLESPSALGLLWAGIRSDQEVIPLNSIASQPQDQIEVFEQSRKLAAAAAARSQGLDVQLSGTGARVVQAIRGTPAYGVLRPGDVIVAVDGRPIAQDSEVREEVRSRREGSRFALTVERGDKRMDVDLRSAKVEANGESAAAIGVFLETRDFDVSLPFEVEFRNRPGIGGPSAGLAYALVIAEMLGADDLGRARTIAATGTVDVRGIVGEIGGVAEKAVGAKQKEATLFIVPEAESSGVSLPGLSVHGVTTLEEALDALRRAS
jgi:PDZ domain-containing secreted protein/Zn-dependent protease/CBS domain-containing protein